MFKRLRDYFGSPFSVDGLEKRIARLPECPYRLVLVLVKEQLKCGRISADDGRRAIEWVRHGVVNEDESMLVSGLMMLRLDKGQISCALNLLQNMDDDFDGGSR